MRPLSLFLLLLLTVPATAQTTNDLIVPFAAAPRVVVPIVGNAPGSNGTYFRTDISVVNLRDVSQGVQIFWYPQGRAGSATPLGQIEIPAQQGISSEDFVGEILLQTGLGGVEFVGVTAQGNFDPAAALHVSSRIWTPRPDGGAGTMSQSFPSLVADAQNETIVKAVFGMRRGPQFRLNVGALNPTSTTQRFRFTVAISGAGGTDTQVLEIDVPARSIQHVTVPGTSEGIVQVLIEDLGGGAGDWQGWASSVDNQSGDAWSQIAVGG